MSAPETEGRTSRGEKLSDLRKAARIWAGFEPLEVIEAETEVQPETAQGEKS